MSLQNAVDSAKITIGSTHLCLNKKLIATGFIM